MRAIIRRKLKNIKERKEKKINYFWFSVNPKVSILSYTNMK